MAHRSRRARPSRSHSPPRAASACRGGWWNMRGGFRKVRKCETIFRPRRSLRADFAQIFSPRPRRCRAPRAARRAARVATARTAARARQRPPVASRHGGARRRRGGEGVHGMFSRAPPAPPALGPPRHLQSRPPRRLSLTRRLLSFPMPLLPPRVPVPERLVRRHSQAAAARAILFAPQPAVSVAGGQDQPERPPGLCAFLLRAPQRDLVKVLPRRALRLVLPTPLRQVHECHATSGALAHVPQSLSLCRRFFDRGHRRQDPCGGMRPRLPLLLVLSSASFPWR